MKTADNLNDVKVGDKFVIHRGWSRDLEIVTCEKVTPKRAKIGHCDYVKETARPLGGDRCNRSPVLYALTDELLQTIYAQNCRYNVTQCKFQELTDEQIKQIYAIIKETKA